MYVYTVDTIVSYVLFRMLLWDRDERTYGYYIEVSTDQKMWSRVMDRSTDSCRSWQTIQFDPRPVTFIKIVGTVNTANEVFHVVHFECPASKDTSKQQQQQQPVSLE